MKVPPASVARVVERMRAALLTLHRQLVPAPVAMLELVTSAWLSQAIAVAADLGVADALEGGPQSLEELARAIGANSDALQRLLRALSQYGIFEQTSSGKFANSRLSEVLRSEGQASIRGFASFVGSRQHREHWSALERAVRTGEPSIAGLRGKTFFEYAEADAVFGGLFNRAMTSVSEMVRWPVLAAYDFSNFRRIVDVGGGHGALLAAILHHAPHARGVLFDLPNVTSGAGPVLAREGVAERCDIESGSFFEHVPEQGDVYLLKQIVHDWADHDAARILRRVREAMAPNAKVLVLEMVLPDDDTLHPGKVIDLEMLVSVGGRERTRSEFENLLAQADLRLSRVVETAGPVYLVEAVAR